MAMRTRKAFGCAIVVGSSSYHTFDDWKLTIVNNNYIGEPEVETNYLDVLGMQGQLDYSEALTGRPVYKTRSITIQLQGLRERKYWDQSISDIRNLIHGRKVKVIFDNDAWYYWLGRIYVREFDREEKLGAFTLEMPEADAYKYERFGSQDANWLWDPFDFTRDVIRYIGPLTISGSRSLVIPKGTMLTAPKIIVGSITSQTLTMHSNSNNKTYTLAVGTNRFPDLLLCGPNNVTLSFTGSGTVNVDYRGGSL